MTKVKVTPEMEKNGVDRSVDFTLKKEDLMLLILEGRKEIMETEIAKLQDKSTKFKADLKQAQANFEGKMRKLMLKTLNSEAKRLVQSFAKPENEDVDLGKLISVEFSTHEINKTFTKFVSRPLGNDGRTSAYIKQQLTDKIDIWAFSQVRMSLTMSLKGKTFSNKSEVFKRNDFVQPSDSRSQSFELLNDYLDIEYQKTLPEFKVLDAIAGDLAHNEQLLSEIITEYDLFTRNQPRSKAKMIKEVLNRDDAGRALMENIAAAAKGQALLG